MKRVGLSALFSIALESGAQADAASGMLTWRMVLEPGQAKTLVFAYSVRYPKGGQAWF